MTPRRMKQNLIRSIQLIKSIHHRLDRNTFLQANTRLLLAVSGGQDSMAVISFFLQIKNQRQYRIGFCWCNHLWQYDAFHAMHHLMRLAFTLREPIFFLIQPTSHVIQKRKKKDWGQVRSEALPSFYNTLLFPIKRRRVFLSSQAGEIAPSVFQREKGRWINGPLKREEDKFSTSLASTELIPKTTNGSDYKSVDVVEINGHDDRRKKKRLFTESGARSWRYQSCQRLATFHRFRILHVGHTASDRIETGVFHLLRGSGMRGMASIQQSRVFRHLYPKQFSFSNFYGIEVEMLEDKKEGLKSTQRRTGGSPQKTLPECAGDLFRHETRSQKECQIMFSLKSRRVNPVHPARLVTMPFWTKAPCQEPLSLYGFHRSPTIQFFYSSCRKKQNVILLLHRPLLSVSRSDVKRICQLWQLPLYPDASNQNVQYARNRIRNQLLPTLRFQFNRQVDATFLHLTNILSTAQLHMEYLAQRLFPSISVVATEYIALDVGGVNCLPLVIRRETVKSTLEKNITGSLHFAHLDILFQFFERTRLQQHQRSGTSGFFLLSKKMTQEKIVDRRRATEVDPAIKQISSLEDVSIPHFFSSKSSPKGKKAAQKETMGAASPLVGMNDGDATIYREQDSSLFVRTWKKHLGMPTHRFLPTTGCFLFLGETC